MARTIFDPVPLCLNSVSHSRGAPHSGPVKNLADPIDPSTIYRGSAAPNAGRLWRCENIGEHHRSSAESIAALAPALREGSEGVKELEDHQINVAAPLPHLRCLQCGKALAFSDTASYLYSRGSAAAATDFGTLRT